MAYPKKPQEVKDKAFAVVALTGSPEEAAKEAGVSDTAIRNWIADSPERLEEIRRTLQGEYLPSLAGIISDLLKKAYTEIPKVDVKTAKDLQSVLTAAAIALDKQRVLLGIPDKAEIAFGPLQAMSPNDLDDRWRALHEREKALQAVVIDAPERESNMI